MPVTDVRKDPDTQTMTVTAEFDASVERVWRLWADPRQLERWWGPPTYPATVEQHDLTEGGRVTYVMTGPDGERHGGYWDVLKVEAPYRIELLDGFADSAGKPNDDMPVTRTAVSIGARDGGGATMVLTSTFASREAMDQLIGMGMEEGLTSAMGQIDGLLAEPVTTS